MVPLPNGGFSRGYFYQYLLFQLGYSLYPILWARFFLEKMGALYRLEEDYQRLELSAQEIKKRRNDASTNKIVDDLRNELFDLLALPKDDKSDLMQRALNYLHSFWKQLFAYRNNGEYTIDNLAAERAIRPLIVQRKKKFTLR